MLFDIYNIGKWYDIVVNDLGFRKGKYLGNMCGMLLVTVYQGIVDTIARKPKCMGGRVGGWSRVLL